MGCDAPRPRPTEWLTWLASLAPSARDGALEARLGIEAPTPSSPPGEHLIGYHASGVAPIVRMLLEVPILADDVVIDLGAGLGKVALLTSILTGATARGIELEPALVERAREAAERFGLKRVSFVLGDAREADLNDGTIFFLYAPFTGPVLAKVMDRLRDVASRRAIVVCALGIELHREHRWLVRRAIDSFWLTIYDSHDPVVPARVPRPRSPLAGRDAAAIAMERVAEARDLHEEKSVPATGDALAGHWDNR